jgi:hypothetical protein
MWDAFDKDAWEEWRKWHGTVEMGRYLRMGVPAALGALEKVLD